MHRAHFQIKILFLLAALVGLGLLPRLNIKVNPSPKIKTLSVDFHYPGAGPELVEEEVTSVLERALSRLDRLKNLTSTSKTGGGHLQLEFNRQAKMEDIRLMASTILRQVYPSLPRQASYPVVSYDSDYESYPTLMVYAAISDLSSESLGKLIEQEVILPLSALKDIYKIEKTGLPAEEYAIRIDDQKLQRHGISYDDVKNKIANWSRSENLGLVQEPRQQQLLSVRYMPSGLQPQLKNALESLPVKMVAGRLIYLKDVARVRQQKTRPSRYYRINGKNSVNLIIKADPDANQIALAGKIKEKLKEQKKALGASCDLLLQTDRSEYLKKELDTITKRMLAALGILFVFMLMIYRSFRRLWPIWFGFVITLLLSVIVYYFAGLELHLYSLAGLTLSLGIVLDNIIIAAEHLRHQRSQRIVLALLAATLTTIGALSIIFFISPEYREQLTDFAWIFFINLAMSLVVGLFFLPTIIKPSTRQYTKRKRRLVRFNRVYLNYSLWVSRRRWLPLLVLVLAFGLPLFLLPDELEGEDKWSTTYNEVMTGTYGKNIHSPLSKYLGGTLRLFVQGKDRFYFSPQKKQETRLYLQAKMPFGGTLEQLNGIIQDFERYLSRFPQIDQFHSSVNSPDDSQIEISFKEEYADGFFPFQLKALLEEKAIESGSGDFRVYGVGRGFSNEVRGGRLSTHLRLLGYQYDQIWKLAREGRQQLLQHPRIQKVFINSTRNYLEPSTEYFELRMDENLLNPSSRPLADIAQYWSTSNPDQGIIAIGRDQGRAYPIRLMTTDEQKNQLWNIQHTLQPLDSGRFFKPNLFSRLEKRTGSNDIVRYNQQYQLYLEYDFIGPYRLGQEVEEQVVEDIAVQLPPGYSISSRDRYQWWQEETDQLTLIVLASLFLIFLISAILFNSLRQAFIPLILIPPAYIGVFVINHFADFRFDQGGFAALLLVAGLSVNAGIFIINDYNNIKKRRPGLSSAKVFIKAFNAKIIPIFLTGLSTILGLLPFLLFEQHEPFWYALAICVIVGMGFSLLGVVVFLPCLMRFGGRR